MGIMHGDHACRTCTRLYVPSTSSPPSTHDRTSRCREGRGARASEGRGPSLLQASSFSIRPPWLLLAVPATPRGALRGTRDGNAARHRLLAGKEKRRARGLTGLSPPGTRVSTVLIATRNSQKVQHGSAKRWELPRRLYGRAGRRSSTSAAATAAGTTATAAAASTGTASPRAESSRSRYRRGWVAGIAGDAAPSHATPSHATPSHATPGYATPGHAASGHAASGHVRAAAAAVLWWPGSARDAAPGHAASGYAASGYARAAAAAAAAAAAGLCDIGNGYTIHEAAVRAAAVGGRANGGADARTDASAGASAAAVEHSSHVEFASTGGVDRRRRDPHRRSQPQPPQCDRRTSRTQAAG